MKRFVLVLAVVILAGCGAKPPEPIKPVPAVPVEPSAKPTTSQAAAYPPNVKKDAITTKNLDSQLVPYTNELLGISFSYPEHLEKPEIMPVGYQPLQLNLGNGEISITRKEAKPGVSPQDLARESIEVNTKASNGRRVYKDLGEQTLGSEEAWAVQHYFASAAGRTDGILYFVITGGFEYRVYCATKQGPPVIAWENVEPVCRRILASIKFGP